jgi:hypothetical protein
VKETTMKPNYYLLPDGQILNFPEQCTGAVELFQLKDRTLVLASKVAGLVAPPRVLFGRSLVERWEKGTHGDRRVRQLRAAGIAVSTRTVNDTRKLWNELGADRVTVDVTEVSYTLPAQMPAPPAPTMPQPMRAALYAV